MGCSGSVPAQSGTTHHRDHQTCRSDRNDNQTGGEPLLDSNNSGVETGGGKGKSTNGSSTSDHVPQNAPISTEENAMKTQATTTPVKCTGTSNPISESNKGNNACVQPNISDSQNYKNGTSTKTEEDASQSSVTEPKTFAETKSQSNTVEHSSKASEPAVTDETAKSDTNPNSSATASNKQPKPDTVMRDTEEEEAQRQFTCGLNGLNLAVNPDSFISSVSRGVRTLTLSRAPPHTLHLYTLVSKLTHLQVLDVSNNQLGPQPFRLLMLALSTNSTLLSLKAANNGADTDSAACVGKLVSSNSTLLYLDVSGNHLGKDYLSRCLGSALKVNTTLQTLRLEGTGATDVTDLLSGLAENSSITQLDISNNDISDRTVVGTALGKCLQKSDCVLECVNLKNCNLNEEGLERLREGLTQNRSLTELNVSGNQFKTVENLSGFLLTCCNHPALQQLTADNTKVTEDSPQTADSSLVSQGSDISNLRVISLSNSGLTNHLLCKLGSVLKGRLLCLEDLNLSDNPALSPECIVNIVAMTTGDVGQSSLARLNFGLNEAGKLPDMLNSSALPLLSYLNLRKAKISAASVATLQPLITPKEKALKTLVLDGLKLAGTEALRGLLGKPAECSLAALSLSGCLLSDADLPPLTSALKAGLPLHMLKLSANRITDNGVIDLVSGILGNKLHPLAVLDLSNNQVGVAGAVSLAELFTSKCHTSQLHSLNLSHNNIGKAGLSALVSHVRSPVKTLYLNNQRVSLEEEEISEVMTSLGHTLGYKLQADGSGRISEGCGTNVSTDSIFVNLSGLGGHVGEAGRLLDCASIITDYKVRQVSYLSLRHICQLSACVRHSDTDRVVLSSEEWNMVTGCQKDREIPSWLQVDDSRKRAVYLTNLPGTTTARRLEGLFESEADAEIDEICLLKDPVSRKMNGLAWCLMSDTASVDRLMEYFHRGEAQVFGQPFLISPVWITVDNAASAGVEEQARQDRERRARERQSDDVTHRNLIRQSAEESWKRHAYRLAHPAYADGRVW